ncbi:hypothetical protein P3S68_013989 [Capsicum galapagoense]
MAVTMRVTTPLICFSLLASIVFLSKIWSNVEDPTLQLRGSFRRNWKDRLKAVQPKKVPKSGGFMAEEYGSNKEECSIGTVPIRKATTKQLPSARYASSSLAHVYFGYKWIDVIFLELMLSCIHISM